MEVATKGIATPVEAAVVVVVDMEAVAVVDVDAVVLAATGDLLVGNVEELSLLRVLRTVVKVKAS